MGRVVNEFTPLSHFQQRRIIQLDTHFTSNVALLDDNQVVYWGWALDALTQIRTLNWYKSFPRLVHIWQSLAPLGKHLSMRNYFDEPNLMNRQLLDKRVIKVQLGAGFI